MTLNCVGLAQSSVKRIIHHNVGLKCFFIYLNGGNNVASFFLTFIFHKVV